MKIIDSHLHFWKYDAVRHQWIGDEMAGIRRDFLPCDLAGVFLSNDISGGIAVQADQTEEETSFLLGLASEFDWIRGVVGWVDLQSPVVEGKLEYYREFPVLKGFRHILQGEVQRDLCLKKDFLRGIGLLERFGYTYDILVLPDQLKFLPEFAGRFPELRFVLDHMAKPMIRDGEIDSWRADIQRVALYENVYCKVSGMVTEADMRGWKEGDFAPYLDVVVEAFGMERLMYGSDWPVCLAAGSYFSVLGLVSSYFKGFSKEEQQRFFAGNAKGFYGL